MFKRPVPSNLEYLRPTIIILGILLLEVQSAVAAGACGKSPKSNADWIDSSTPADSCRKLVLVFSDEFEAPRTSFDGQYGDTKWTAMDMHYSSDNAEDQNYKPQQVDVSGGALNIHFASQPSTADLHAFSYTAPVKKSFTSGMLQSWNKFCFTGGYVEFAVKLPGNPRDSGLWAATWLEGNLGRAGYYKSLTGQWPYSYDKCNGSRAVPWSNQPGQRISACDGGTGRGAPEIDVLEYGILGGTATPQYVHTMQMAPVAPLYTTWMTPISNATKAPQGVFLPGAGLPGLATHLGPPYGQMDKSADGFPRAGSNITDTFSGSTTLNDTHFTGYHRYSVLWEPGEFVRWYLDDDFLFEVNKEALRRMENSQGQSIEQRLIPKEAMYIVMNLAMSDRNWAPLSDALKASLEQSPAVMSVDYVRVWQAPGAINVGCDPPDLPTREWIACHRDEYLGPGESWNLGLCSSVSTTGNTYMIAFGSVAVAWAVGMIGAMWLMRTWMKTMQEQQHKLTPEELAAARCRDLAKREAGCYVSSNMQTVLHLMKINRPDLYAITGLNQH
eukprot:gene6745-6965_t